VYVYIYIYIHIHIHTYREGQDNFRTADAPLASSRSFLSPAHACERGQHARVSYTLTTVRAVRARVHTAYLAICMSTSASLYVHEQRPCSACISCPLRIRLSCESDAREACKPGSVPTILGLCPCGPVLNPRTIAKAAITRMHKKKTETARTGIKRQK